ncbi:hypothetical protein [Neisseria musculi]|uniref:hypothetical protein n=1 Tax=Neisseria musculi TaxID=1815583 RepID=UPI00164C2F95|nr:hypothetical protein [Neisseria musculi]
MLPPLRQHTESFFQAFATFKKYHKKFISRLPIPKYCQRCPATPPMCSAASTTEKPGSLRAVGSSIDFIFFLMGKPSVSSGRLSAAGFASPPHSRESERVASHCLFNRYSNIIFIRIPVRAEMTVFKPFRRPENIFAKAALFESGRGGAAPV